MLACGVVSAVPTELAVELDEATRRIVEFERTAGRRGRSKDRAIRELLGMSPTRYHQLLVDALDRPEVLAYDPMLVRRLRRLRDARRRVRFAGRLADRPVRRAPEPGAWLGHPARYG